MNTAFRQAAGARLPIGSPALTPARAMIRRACACGGGGGLSGTCEACEQKKLLAARMPAMAAPGAVRPVVPSPVVPSPVVPGVVHEVLRSPGQALDGGARAFMEPRFGRDFSQVRIHTDARAAASAAAVNARAYTVGRDIVFAGGAYRPGTPEGRTLLAHELAHVAQQQGSAASGPLEIGDPHDAAEREAEAVASAVTAAPAGSVTAPAGARSFSARVGTAVHGVTLAPHSLARQTAGAQRSRLQCINANLSNAGIPWAVLAIAGGVCGLIGAVAGLATGPGAPAASPSAAAVAAAYCIAAVSGASVGLVLGVITRCIQDPSVEWVFAQNTPAPGAADTGEAGASAASATA